jgi:hypothetical protein
MTETDVKMQKCVTCERLRLPGHDWMSMDQFLDAGLDQVLGEAWSKMDTEEVACETCKELHGSEDDSDDAQPLDDQRR